MISRVTTAGEPEEGLFKRAGCQVSSLADWATERKLPRPFEVSRDWQGTQTFCEAIPGPRQQNGTIAWPKGRLPVRELLEDIHYWSNLL